MDRLQAMAAFVAVVEEGGFAAAARALRVSAPVVTRAVGELEERLGTRLLTRTTRVVRVTEAGARYAGDCRRLLAGIAEADEAAGGSHGVPRGQLTVTAPVLFGSLFVMPIVARYVERHAEVTIACWFVDRLVNLVEEGADVAVRVGELPDSSLQATRVGRVRRVLCASPEYLARVGTPTSPQELVQHTIVSASGISPTHEWPFVDGGRAVTVKLAPRITTTTNDSAVAAALAGVGMTRLLSYQVAQEIEAGRLHLVLADHEPPPLPVHVVHREGRYASPKVRAFIDLACEALRADPTLR